MKKFEPIKQGIYKYEVYDYNGNYIPYELRVEVLGESDSGKTYQIKTLEVGAGRLAYVRNMKEKRWKQSSSPTRKDRCPKSKVNYK